MAAPMAAPSGTVWGDVVKGTSHPDSQQGKIGIYVKENSRTETNVKLHVEVWFKTIYSCYDGSNTVKFNMGTDTTSATTNRGSVDISHEVYTGPEWNDKNQTKLYVFDSTDGYDRTKSDKVVKIYASFSGIDMLNGTMYVNTTYTVPKLRTFKISYNANGGSGAPSSQTKYYGIDLTLSPTKPTKTGYTFKGWSLTKGGSVYYQAGGTCGKNENLTLYAVWEENALTVNYYSNYATSAFDGALNAVGSDKNVKVHVGTFYYDNDYSTYGLYNYSGSDGSVYMTRTGYTATKYWGTSTSGGTLIHEDTGFATGQALAKALGKDISSGNASVNIYAQWKVNSYTYNIVYKSSTGVQLETATISKDYGTTNTVSPKSFAGYTSPSSQSVKWDSTTAKTITFTYTPITYNVTINCNGGSGVNSRTYTVETATFTLGTPTRTGHTFNGWTGSNGDTAQKTISISKGSTGDKSYTAQWRANVLTIKYHPNGGKINSNQYYINNGLIGIISSSVVLEDKWDYNNAHENGLYNAATFGLKREGYKFIGWKVGSDGTIVFDQDDASIVPTDLASNITTGDRTVTLYAVWEISGVVYIDNGTSFDPYLAYIDNGTGWDLYLVYVDDGTTWHIIS